MFNQDYRLTNTSKSVKKTGRLRLAFSSLFSMFVKPDDTLLLVFKDLLLTALDSQFTVLSIHWVQTQFHITLSHNCYPDKNGII